MPTMNVSLTPELAKFVEGQVARGDYGTASEVVRAALRLLARDREIYQQKLEAFRREARVGMDAADRGEVFDITIDDIGDEVLAELEREAAPAEARRKRRA